MTHGWSDAFRSRPKIARRTWASTGISDHHRCSSTTRRAQAASRHAEKRHGIRARSGEKGAVVWKIDLARKPAPNNGQIAFGGSTDAKRTYIALQDGRFAAIDIATGKLGWDVRLESLDNLGEQTINGEYRTKAGLRFGQSAAVTGIPGAVFTGGWDGTLRALSTDDGKLLWQFNTAQDFKTVNGVTAKGGSMGGPGSVVAGGMLYVTSGYANVGGGMPGNVLLAFAAK